jgi:hypothetical protein
MEWCDGHSADDIYGHTNSRKPQPFSQIFQAHPNVGNRKIGTELAILE